MLVLWSAIIAGALAIIAIVALRSENAAGDPEPPSIVVGTPAGIALPNASPSPVPTATPEPTPQPTPEPTPEPTPVVTPEPAPVPTAVPATPPPTLAPTPVPATPVPPTPEPVVVVAAPASPADAVAAFYSQVAAGNFDAAYGLWSQRMRDTYPRQDNLDERFGQTASISFEQLYVASQGDGRATVQANFVETYDSGSSRRFVGYWELVLVDGRWLLDAPHY